MAGFFAAVGALTAGSPVATSRLASIRVGTS